MGIANYENISILGFIFYPYGRNNVKLVISNLQYARMGPFTSCKIRFEGKFYKAVAETVPATAQCEFAPGRGRHA